MHPRQGVPHRFHGNAQINHVGSDMRKVYRNILRGSAHIKQPEGDPARGTPSAPRQRALVVLSGVPKLGICRFCGLPSSRSGRLQGVCVWAVHEVDQQPELILLASSKQ
eukprot:scaffold1319_cov126-Cylindrotheca_fusiformis.AAC.58